MCILANYSLLKKNKPTHLLRVVLISPTVPLIQTFYEKLGVHFSSYTFYNDISWKISTNTNICIIKSSKEFSSSQGGLVLFKESLDLITEKESYAYDPYSKLVLLKVAVHSDQFQQLIPLKSSPWVNILRTPSIEDTKNFFTTLGTWVKEKHGSGLFHYSLTAQNQVFEIYPLRKDYTNTLEFLLKASKNMLLSPPPHIIQARSQKRYLIEDPEQRLINFPSYNTSINSL